MATPTTKTEMLKSHAKELVKQYIELDVQNRAWKVYTASSTAVDGMPCEVTEYIYASPTSTTLIGRKEGYDTWDAAWDTLLAFTVLP